MTTLAGTSARARRGSRGCGASAGGGALRVCARTAEPVKKESGGRHVDVEATSIGGQRKVSLTKLGFVGSYNDNAGGYKCSCAAGLAGVRCERGRWCAAGVCAHGGACEEGEWGPSCRCRGYFGPRCQFDVDECAGEPCLNGATCLNEPGSFRCLCPPDKTGQFHLIIIVSYDNYKEERDTCLNGATCLNEPGSFRCLCPPDKTGQFHMIIIVSYDNYKEERDVDECAGEPCLNKPGSFRCLCPPDKTGQFHMIIIVSYDNYKEERDVDECAGEPCLNKPGSFRCLCPPDKTGQFHMIIIVSYDNYKEEKDVDECAGEPCLNGATCLNEPGSFRCLCPPDKTGMNCGNPLYSDAVVSGGVEGTRVLAELWRWALDAKWPLIAVAVTILAICLAVLVPFLLRRKTRPRPKDEPLNSHAMEKLAPGRPRGSKLSNLEAVAVTILAICLAVLVPFLLRRKTRPRPKDEPLNSHVMEKLAPGRPRGSKLSNLEAERRERPASCGGPNDPPPLNNMDTLRSYGSAGDELEGIPPDYIR
ncbi:calcium-binding EGF domain-containing protein [Phthorimaea operculella]|nr:calcium-binding EGF domain-containing protein [Phthorimaea operculella]